MLHSVKEGFGEARGPFVSGIVKLPYNGVEMGSK